MMKDTIKIVLSIGMAVICIFLLTQCSSNTVTDTDSGEDDTTTSTDNTSIEDYIANEDAETIDAEVLNLTETHENSEDYEWDLNTAFDIILNEDSITTIASGVEINGTVATINTAATYRITGTLNDGQIIVDTDDDETVTLLLDDVNISSSSSSPLAIMNAEKAVVVVMDGTSNYLTDATEYVYENADDDEPDAALFSDDSLTIAGTGELTVNGNYNEAIKSKDGLIITDVTLNVTSVDDGIQGKDFLVIKSGTFDINVEGDGLKSNNDDDTTVGYIIVESGSFTIESESDGIQTESYFIAYGGDFDITSGGGSSAYLSEDDSAKGVKANTKIIIAEGTTFNIDAADDGIHSDTAVAIYGGTITIDTGDDGIHSDGDLDINGGTIDVLGSYEGIEGANITLNAGEIHVVASDDGINAAGDSGSFSIDINGGYIYVDASGDGIDSNGTVTMTNGVLLINGPTGGGNGTIDYDGTFKISGGYLVATGTRNMLQAPSSSSTQYAVRSTFSSQSAGSLVHIESADGTSLLTFAPEKSYQSLVFSSPELQSGASYKIYLGGSSTGNDSNGLYVDGTYTSGTLLSTFTLSSIITTAN